MLLLLLVWVIHKILHTENIKFFKLNLTRSFNAFYDDESSSENCVISQPIIMCMQAKPGHNSGIRLIPFDLFLSQLQNLLISSGSVTLAPLETNQLVSEGVT